MVWERGAGLTEACGTGACAAAVAALHEGRLEGTGPVTVRLPGGALEIAAQARRRPGPPTLGLADLVRRGELTPGELLDAAIDRLEVGANCRRQPLRLPKTQKPARM